MEYTIRPGFTINLLGTIYQGGDNVVLDELQFQLHKHKLEGVESDVIPIDPGGGNSNNNNECCYPAPFISDIAPDKILTDKSTKVVISGSFFTPDTTVEIESGSVDAIAFKSSNLIEVTITATSTVTTNDLIIDNGKQIVVEDAIAFFGLPEGLIDLRSGGTEFAPLSIEMRSGMSYSRRSDGLVFFGQEPWNSWARFVGDDDSWVWNRNQKKTLSWIYQNTSNFMIGIGSRANNETSNRQFYEAEVLSYVNTGNSVSSFYGNSGTPGSGRTLGFSASKDPNDIMKAVFSSNGENGSNFSLYKLPSSEVADWLDNTNKLGEITLNGFGDEPNIMPFAIPQNGTSTKFLGFILEDE